MPVKDQFGNVRLVMAKVDVDEKTLQAVSALTERRLLPGNRHRFVEDAFTSRSVGSRRRRRLRSTSSISRSSTAWRCFLPLALLGFGFGLDNTRFRRLP